MADTNTTEERLEDINVAPSATTATTTTTDTSSKPNDDDVDNLLEELDAKLDGTATTQQKDVDDDDDTMNVFSSVPPITITEESEEDPIQMIKQQSLRFASSIAFLSSDVDSKFGISAKAREIDQKVHISQTASSIGGWFSSINQQFGITETAKGVVSGVAEAVTPLAQNVGEGLKDFDEKVGVSRGVVGGVTAGKDFLSKSIAPPVGGSEPDDILAVGEDDIHLDQETKPTDTKEEDFPSSFQN